MLLLAVEITHCSLFLLLRSILRTFFTLASLFLGEEVDNRPFVPDQIERASTYVDHFIIKKIYMNTKPSMNILPPFLPFYVLFLEAVWLPATKYHTRVSLCHRKLGFYLASE